MGKKGNGGELEVAKLLQVWWRQVEPDVEIVRTPGSGGWQYGPEFDACCDLMANKPFPWGVEVKRRERWDLNNLLKGKKTPPWRWWKKCQSDAERVSKEPVMWFRQNRRPWFVMLRSRYMSALQVPAPDVVWTTAQLKGVDYGEALPVLYLASRLLEEHPRVFAAKN